jgi:cytochrome c-type biogenesis protein CcmH
MLASWKRSTSAKFSGFGSVLALLWAQGTAWAEPHLQAADPGVSAILSERIPGAERLEGRLLAPCCWNQTLDTHGSDIAYALRREIRSRLKAGESAERIESSLVERYGPRLRAVPDRVPLDRAALWGWVGLGLAGVGLLALLVRWRRGRAASVRVSEVSSERDALDERLDAELRRLD